MQASVKNRLHSANSVFSENAVLIALFLIIRFLLVGLLFFITSGEEVASDTRFHRMVIDQPFSIISGLADISVSSYPPLQFLIEWPLFHFFTSFAPDFIGFRLMLISIELCAFLALLSILDKTGFSKQNNLFIKLLFVIAPHQLLTSSVFVQEEVICQLFVVLAVLGLAVERQLLALFMLALCLLTGKIFLVLPMFYLTVFYRRSWSYALPWLMVFGVYGVNVVWAIANNGNIPFVGFSPEANYGSHYWVLAVERYPDFIPLLKRISLLLSVAAQLLICVYFWHKSNNLKSEVNPIPLITIPILVFFFTFYQQNPEYLLLFWPVILLLNNRYWLQLGITVLVSASWAPNIFFGLKNIGLNNSSKSSTRNRVLEPITDWLGLDFVQIHFYSILIYSLLYLIAIFVVLRAIAYWKSSAEIVHKSTS